MANKNNFKKEENKQQCKFKLWAAVKHDCTSHFEGKKTIVRFGYMTKPDNGYNYLLTLAKKIEPYVHSMRLYDNQTKKILINFK
ncbi:hypothetical protein JYU20_00715 [Bacteroidales bacterium AH-315-I05]|nr:hypothetical protein [Bacteroidales bacterium AH-315-I05]